MRETFHSFHRHSHRVFYRFAIENDAEIRELYALITGNAELPENAALAVDEVTGDVAVR